MVTVGKYANPMDAMGTLTKNPKKPRDFQTKIGTLKP